MGQREILRALYETGDLYRLLFEGGQLEYRDSKGGWNYQPYIPHWNLDPSRFRVVSGSANHTGPAPTPSQAGSAGGEGGR